MYPVFLVIVMVLGVVPVLVSVIVCADAIGVPPAATGLPNSLKLYVVPAPPVMVTAVGSVCV